MAPHVSLSSLGGALAALFIGAASPTLAGCDSTVPLPGRASANATALDGGAEGGSCAVDAGPLDDAEVQLGLSLAVSRGCGDCHGGAFGGNYDGVMSDTTEGGLAYPPNLTPDPATGIGCWTREQIVTAILDGIDNEGMPLCPPMPRWGHVDDGGLDAVQARAIAVYLESLPPWVHDVPETPSCTVPGPDTPAGAAPPVDGGEDVEPSMEAGMDAGADARDAAPDCASEAAVDTQDATGQ